MSETKKRKAHSPELKAKVGLEAVRGLKTITEIAQARPLQADVVVPVPLASRRLRQRGFNQARLLAGEIAATVHGAVGGDVLRRDERTAQQTLGAPERLLNLYGALTCQQPAEVHGKRVLLVDDVVTTGATLSACADALAAAGAERITALAFARDL